MGLDMYLRRKTFLNSYTDKVKVEVTLTGENGETKAVPMESVTHITENMMYWRKANAIHQWFVDNVQEGQDDCRAYDLDLDDLKTLRDLCKEVLDNPTKAEELLPPQEGFFFGSTEVDEYYLNDLKETIKVIDEEEARFNTEYAKYGEGVYGIAYSYQSSW